MTTAAKENIKWALRIAIILMLGIIIWLLVRPKEKPDNRTVLEYEIAVLLRNDSTLEIIKHEKVNRIDSLSNDSVKLLITEWIERNK